MGFGAGPVTRMEEGIELEHRKREVGYDVYGHTIYPVSSGAFGYLRTNGSIVKEHYGSEFSM